MTDFVIPVQQIVFFSFSALLILAAGMVIISRNTVHSALFLVFGIFCSSVLWMQLEAEFLSLALIFVYVGAVMTLFLFVVMMLNMATSPKREGFVQYLPFGVIVMMLFVGIMLYVIGPKQFGMTGPSAVVHPENYSNVKELGMVLYTNFFYPFELAAVLLVVAIISAITLAFRGKQHSKSQNIAAQLAVRKEDRLRLVDIDPNSEQS